MARRDRWHWAIAAVYVAWGLFFIESTRVRTPDGLVWSCLFDDAMISMRYARNLAEGNGLVFNPGERVQGFSNPLMTLCMSALIAILGPALSVGAVQLLGIPTVLACAFLAARITRNLFPQAGDARSFVFVATLAYYPLSLWSLTGMETGLLTALLLGAVVSIQSAGWLAAGLLLEIGRAHV
jgi:arabinofuranosyltransferase